MALTMTEIVVVDGQGSPSAIPGQLECQLNRFPCPTGIIQQQWTHAAESLFAFRRSRLNIPHITANAREKLNYFFSHEKSRAPHKKRGFVVVIWPSRVNHSTCQYWATQAGGSLSRYGAGNSRFAGNPIDSDLSNTLFPGSNIR